MAPNPALETLLGLRVDVDTHDGMRDGVPRLLEVFRDAGARATFYFAMGPDRSGLAVCNVLRRGFLTKMLRTDAPRVYGLRTIVSGTLMPSRRIGLAFPEIARGARDQGHDTGVHAWDHRRWQDRLLDLSTGAIAAELDRAYRAYREIFATAPVTSAAPAWLSCDDALRHQERYVLRYASDCRGHTPFLPLVDGRPLTTPQVPATLPTLDEALGTTHDSAAAYFADILEEALRAPGSVLTVHAELEGGPYADDFARFLHDAGEHGLYGVTLGELLARRQAEGALPVCPLCYTSVPGRHGVVSTQDTSAGSQVVQ